MLQKYQDQSPREFFTDYTSDFLEDMDEYIQTNQVF